MRGAPAQLQPARLRNSGNLMRAPLADYIVVVAAATVAQTFVTMGSSTMPVIAPKLAETYGVPVALIGLQVSLVYGSATLAALVSSGLERRWGPCRVMQLSLLLSAIGALLGASAPGVATLALASLFLGSAVGMISPPVADLIIHFAPPGKLNLMFSIKQTGVPLGFMISALTAPIIAVSVGWQWSLALVAVLTLTTAAVLQPVRGRWDARRQADTPLAQSPLEGVRAIWRKPELRYLALSGSCYSMAQVCLATFTVTMLVTEVGYSLVEAGVLQSLINLAGVLARLFWGWLSDRSRNASAVLLLIGCIIIGACGAIAFLTPGWPALAVNLLCIAFGISAVGWNGILNAEVARLSPPGTASLTSSGAAFFVFGVICIGPTLFSVMVQLIGRFTLAIAALALFAALGVVCVLAARRIAVRTSPALER
jgi:predicted MFS family arabinose efflux permease